MNQVNELIMSVESEAAAIVADLKHIPQREQSEWLRLRCQRVVMPLVGMERVTVAFYLGMHVGNLLKASVTDGAAAVIV
jgi:hypothetical protein